jgi:hypothetical protein
MAVAWNRISRSADATGPCGSSTPALRHEATRQAAAAAAKKRKREGRLHERVPATVQFMSDLNRRRTNESLLIAGPIIQSHV